MSSISREALGDLEARVAQACETGDNVDLTVLGYGEISIVLACEDRDRSFACKRLPPFPSREQLDAYRDVFDQYLNRLRTAGVDVLESVVEAVPAADGGWVAYCVQPMLSGDSLLPSVLHAKAPQEAAGIVGQVLDVVRSAASDGLGLDGQSSNWALYEGRLRYLDVTTPFIRNDDGEEQLDYRLFIASLPWLLRGFVRRFLLSAILDKYYCRRGIVVDFLANLIKENLEDRIPYSLEVANTGLEIAIDEGEVRKYYQSDARLWAFMQKIRRLDRFWQRRIRRRVYPFLLPPKIARNV